MNLITTTNNCQMNVFCCQRHKGSFFPRGKNIFAAVEQLANFAAKKQISHNYPQAVHKIFNTARHMGAQLNTKSTPGISRCSERYLSPETLIFVNQASKKWNTKNESGALNVQKKTETENANK